MTHAASFANYLHYNGRVNGNKADTTAGKNQLC